MTRRRQSLCVALPCSALVLLLCVMAGAVELPKIEVLERADLPAWRAGA
jgi:hypothetical protein